MQYQVILASAAYGTIVAVTPPNSSPDTPGVKCYRRQDWWNGVNKEDVFFQIEPWEASLAYTCQHDFKAGSARLPDRTFDSLADIDVWVEERRKEVQQVA